ncbi:hydroxyphenylacetyl-CoA thioesterase PaaI [Kordiimonas lipolytica]|uniref:Hydroxyphenylacetyl-CoA thioesterase PaaI n=1 Tax=Kordiimonas lipolytica TaxID=1662421 RepID=A0ABV8UBE2_9PROT|nr:hydroxyphenylacetyl-CoA thioesterase PaaI [Kordiimonas lipolytica]
MSFEKQELARRCANHLLPRAKMDGLMDIRMLDVGPGYAKLSMVVREDMLNFYGTAHGGAVFSLADSAFALACNTTGFMTVASGCSIEFLRPSQPGDELTAVCRLSGDAGKSGIYHTEIFNGDDELVASFTGRAHRTSTPIDLD